MDWNGVDKTTLVNALVGFVTPRHGEIRFKGMGRRLLCGIRAL
jgi:ABC-type branched-subunit amino acid transport system ATPase component